MLSDDIVAMRLIVDSLASGSAIAEKCNSGHVGRRLELSESFGVGLWWTLTNLDALFADGGGR